MNAVFLTDQGKVRQHNEDRVGIFKNESSNYLAVVADGMGGHNAGDVASEMTILKFKNMWEEVPQITTPDSAEQWLLETTKIINAELYTHAKTHKECEGMGTTVVAVITTDSFATIINIGDSRCYILNDQGFSQLTEDHSLVNELVRSGEISKEDAEHHPRKNVLLKALGTDENVIPDIKTITFEDGNILLLCSDGLSNKVSEGEIKEILQQTNTLNEKGNYLVDLANKRGGEDNITLAILVNEEDDGSGDVQC